MSKTFLLILVVLASGLGLLMLLTSGVGPQVSKPTQFNIEYEAGFFAESIGTSALTLFNSDSGTLALLRQMGPAEPHIHHESNELIYVLSGTGRAMTEMGEHELIGGSMMIFFEGAPVVFEQTGEEPLDLLVFLAPPSHEANVSRYESTGEAIENSINALQPLSINIHTLQSENSDHLNSTRSVAKFARTAKIDILTVNKHIEFKRSDTTDRLIYVVSGAGMVMWGEGFEGTTYGQVRENFVWRLPPGRSYKIEAEQPLQLLLITTPVE